MIIHIYIYIYYIYIYIHFILYSYCIHNVGKILVDIAIMLLRTKYSQNKTNVRLYSAPTWSPLRFDRLWTWHCYRHVALTSEDFVSNSKAFFFFEGPALGCLGLEFMIISSWKWEKGPVMSSVLMESRNFIALCKQSCMNPKEKVGWEMLQISNHLMQAPSHCLAPT